MIKATIDLKDETNQNLSDDKTLRDKQSKERNTQFQGLKKMMTKVTSDFKKTKKELTDAQASHGQQFKTSSK